MALQTQSFPILNYSQQLIQPDYSNFSNLLPNAIKAYNQPIQLKQEREGREYKNREQMINAYLKEKYGEPEMESKIGLTNAQIQSQLAHARHSDALTSKTHYDIGKSKREEAEYDTDGGMDSDSISMKGLPKNEQLAASKAMMADRKVAQNMASSYDIIQKMKKVNDDNPELADYFEQSLAADKEGRATLLNQFKRSFMDKKKLAEIEKYDKLSDDLALKYQQVLGSGTRATDNLRNMIKNAKSSSRNTQTANRFVLDNLSEETGGGKAWDKAIEKAQKSRRVLYASPDKYKQMYMQEQAAQVLRNSDPNAQGGIEEQTGSPFNNQMVTVQYKGKMYYNLPPEKAQQVISKGGVVVNGQ